MLICQGFPGTFLWTVRNRAYSRDVTSHLVIPGILAVYQWVIAMTGIMKLNQGRLCGLGRMAEPWVLVLLRLAALFIAYFV